MCLPKRCQMKAAAIAEALLQAELDGFFLMAQKCNFRNTGLDVTFPVSCYDYRSRFRLGLAWVIAAGCCSRRRRAVALPGRTALLWAPACRHCGGTGSRKPPELHVPAAAVGVSGTPGRAPGEPRVPQSCQRAGRWVCTFCTQDLDLGFKNRISK